MLQIIKDLKALRKAKKMTPEELSVRLGVSARSVYRWEQDEKPSKLALRRIEEYLKTSN